LGLSHVKGGLKPGREKKGKNRGGPNFLGGVTDSHKTRERLKIRGTFNANFSL